MKSTGISDNLIEALKKDNIKVPTKVQSLVIPEAIKNLDIIAQSKTGTGKTLAYLLPIFQKHSCEEKNMQVIILTPTHELAIQVVREVEKLSSNSDNKLTVMPVIGNVNIDRQIKKLKTKPNILVGSPGRVLELIKKKRITAHTVKTIVIDEADRLLDKNNIDVVLSIVKSTLRERQVMCFSATMPNNIIEKAKDITKEAKIIKCDTNISVPKDIEHLYFEVEQRKKVELFRKLVSALDPKKCIVFVDPSKDIEIITEKLKFHKINAESLHGNNIKFDRKNTIKDFKDGKLQFLIASDIAARGLDIKDVTHIINFNLHENLESYVHRAGRTGRNGNSGLVISLVNPRELGALKNIEKKLNIKMYLCDLKNGKLIYRNSGFVN